jgi:hypothetical protein
MLVFAGPEFELDIVLAARRKEAGHVVVVKR